MNARLNAICPYFAMFPLSYPEGIIKGKKWKTVLDPFCGRGTTNMAARLNGIYSVGIDSSPVAAAISAAKLVSVTPKDIYSECEKILRKAEPNNVPEGEFWSLMYDRQTLRDICAVRESLIDDCSTPKRIALRAIVMGALHGPLRTDGSSSYLSNQFPRTYASKPDYSVRYWNSRGLTAPPKVSLQSVVNCRADRYYSGDSGQVSGFIQNGDSTDIYTFDDIIAAAPENQLFDAIITSPPYIGMYTYRPDQWIRNWFVGGPPDVDYTVTGQIHEREEGFIAKLRSVWKNCETVCNDGATMAVRFGNVSSSASDPIEVIRRTFESTSWRIESISDAGVPSKGKRQSDTFSLKESRSYKEIDVVASLN